MKASAAWEVLTYDNPEERRKWRSLCSLFPDIDIQYYPEYAHLFQLKGDGLANCFVYRSSEEELVLYPFLKRRINEMTRFRDLPDDVVDITSPYGYGGYLRNSRRVDMAAFYEAFHQYCRDNQVVSEFVRFHPLLSNHGYAPREVSVQKWNDTVAIDLSLSEEELWSRLVPACRNKINKAQKGGVRILMDETLSNLGAFFRLYTATMRRLHASAYYLFPSAWFESLTTLFPANAVLGHAFEDERLIASGLFLFSEMFMHYFLSGSDQDARRLGANNFLLFEAALWGQSKGLKCLHLGGGQEPGDDLFHFKASFSPVRAPFYIGEKIHEAASYEALSARSRGHSAGKPGYGRLFPAYRALQIQLPDSTYLLDAL